MSELLKKVQDTELEIVLEIDRICREENIEYYLYYGTLIGAVRHGGFIPWDDDIDIVLFREDYDKLMKVLPEKLGEKYWLQNYDTDEEYWHLYAKVRKKGTLYKEKNTENIPDEKCGIWVDIFPLDNAHPKRSVDKAVNGILKTMEFAIKQKVLQVPNSEFSRRFLPFIKFWELFSKQSLIKKEDKLLRKFNKRSTPYCTNMGNVAPKAPTLYKKASFGVKRISFENEMLPVPQDFDDILTTCYGNYMKIPPENERFVHTPTDVVV